MTVRTFTFTLDDGARLMVLTALGFASMHLLAANGCVEMRRPIDELIALLSSANGQDALPLGGVPGVRAGRTVPEVLETDIAALQRVTGTEAARAVLKPPTPVPAQLHDYFAVDRSGNIPIVAPKGAQVQFVDIQATKESVDRKHLKVIFKGGKANCFDRELWPQIVKQTGHVGVPLWIVESKGYLNIVGVRA